MVAKGADREPLKAGQRVLLRQALAGYDAGAPGVVTRSSREGEAAFVRFDRTGHTLLVSRDLLEPAEPA
jgi:hypothetical protein